AEHHPSVWRLWHAGRQVDRRRFRLRRRTVRRLAIAPRPNWRELAERSGFGTHPPIGAPYWVDGAFYAFTADQIERHIEPATAELIAMCLTVVERASTDDEVLATLKIPQAWWDPIRDSWRRGERSLCARFDLA